MYHLLNCGDKIIPLVLSGFWGCLLAPLFGFLIHCHFSDFLIQFQMDFITFNLSSSWRVRELFPSQFEFSGKSPHCGIHSDQKSPGLLTCRAPFKECLLIQAMSEAVD